MNKKEHDSVCFIGPYSRRERRNLVILEGFQKNNIQYQFATFPYFGSRGALENKNRFFLLPRFLLILLPMVLVENLLTILFGLYYHRKIKKTNILFMGSYSNYSVLSGKILALVYKKKLIFDAHGSLYYQRIIGCEDADENSWYGKILFWFDQLSAKVVDKYITLSKTYAIKLAKDFQIHEDKFMGVYLGFIYESNQPSTLPTVQKNVDILHLSYNKSFHGVKNIVKIAEHIIDNTMYQNLHVLITCVDKNLITKKYKNNIQSAEVYGMDKIEHIRSAKTIIGAMGESTLNQIDFSKKMCEALAFGKVLITQDTPSARELLQDGINAILINIHDREGSAQKIVHILTNNETRKNIENAALKTYKKYLQPEIIVRDLVEYIQLNSNK